MKDENGLENEKSPVIEDPKKPVDATGDSADDTDDEFEYDEEGNIIIPDIAEDEESEGQDDDAESGDDDNGENAEEDGATDGDEEASDEENEENEPSGDTPADDTAKNRDEDVEEQPAKPDARDAELNELRRKLRAYESQTTDTLKKLGVETDDPMHGLAKLAAEAIDKPVDDYIKERAAAQRDEDARTTVQRMKFEAKMRADLAEVQAAYPETRKYKSMTEISNFADFGKARDAGLTPKQAYAAANPDAVRSSVATAVKQQSLNDTKSHLKSNVPKGSKDNSVTMSKATLAEWRGYFPNKSDKEIVSLYKNTLK